MKRDEDREDRMDRMKESMFNIAKLEVILGVIAAIILLLWWALSR